MCLTKDVRFNKETSVLETKIRTDHLPWECVLCQNDEEFTHNWQTENHRNFGTMGISGTLHQIGVKDFKKLWSKEDLLAFFERIEGEGDVPSGPKRELRRVLEEVGWLD